MKNIMIIAGAALLATTAFAQQKREVSPRFVGTPLIGESIKLDDNGPRVFSEGQAYNLQTTKPYKSIKIENPEAVDVVPISDRQVTIIPMQWVGSHILFYDENDQLIKDLDVQVRHDTTVMVRGPRHGLSSFYRCWDKGCDFVSEDKLEYPAIVQRSYNINIPDNGQ